MASTITTGFASATLDTEVCNATAEITVVEGNDDDNEDGETFVNINIDGEVYWGASDLRELAELLFAVADEIEG